MRRRPHRATSALRREYPRRSNVEPEGDDPSPLRCHRSVPNRGHFGPVFSSGRGGCRTHHNEVMGLASPPGLFPAPIQSSTCLNSSADFCPVFGRQGSSLERIHPTLYFPPWRCTRATGSRTKSRVVTGVAPMVRRCPVRKLVVVVVAVYVMDTERLSIAAPAARIHRHLYGTATKVTRPWLWRRRCSKHEGSPADNLRHGK